MDEVEQVRQALGLDRDNFYLLGHSWGGILAIEYALQVPAAPQGAHHLQHDGQHSRPTTPTPTNVLMPAMDQAVLAEIKRLEAAGDYREPALHGAAESSTTTCSTSCACRAAEWPDPVNRAFKHINPAIYVPMQGPSELGAERQARELGPHRRPRHRSTVPTLVDRRAARHDGPGAHGDGWRAQFPNGRYLHCPNGSHMAMYDDQKTYMDGVIRFLQDVDRGSF